MLINFFVSAILLFPVVCYSSSDIVNFPDGLSIPPKQLKNYSRELLSMEKEYNIQEDANNQKSRIIVMFGNKVKDIEQAPNINRNGYVNLDECITFSNQEIMNDRFDSQEFISLFNNISENREYIILGYKKGGIYAAHFARKLLDAIYKKSVSSVRKNNNAVKLYGIYPSSVGNGLKNIEFRNQLAHDLGSLNCCYFVPPTLIHKYGHNYPGIPLDVISYEYYYDNWKAATLLLVNMASLSSSIYCSVEESVYGGSIPWSIFALGLCSNLLLEPNITPETIEAVYNSVKGRKENRGTDITNLGRVSLFSTDRGFLKIAYNFFFNY